MAVPRNSMFPRSPSNIRITADRKRVAHPTNLRCYPNKRPTQNCRLVPRHACFPKSALCRPQRTSSRSWNVYPRVTRMPNMLIVGSTNNGKSSIIERFAEQHPPDMNPEGDAAIAPVILIEAPPTPDVSDFYGRISMAVYWKSYSRPSSRTSRLQICSVRSQTLRDGDTIAQHFHGRIFTHQSKEINIDTHDNAPSTCKGGPPESFPKEGKCENWLWETGLVMRVCRRACPG